MEPTLDAHEARFDLDDQPRQRVNSEETKNAEEKETAKEASAI